MEKKETAYSKALEQVCENLYNGVTNIIDHAKREIVVYVNKQANMMFGI